MTLNERRLAFLQETVEFYSVDPPARRAIGYKNTCLYKTEDGKKCAIGRHIPEEKYDVGLEMIHVYDVIETCLSPEIQELGRGFLRSVQGIHDGKENWDAIGLTEEGTKRVELIQNCITSGNYD